MNTQDYRGAILSADGMYRYKLWRKWDFALKVLPWVMLNPSTADADKDDATIRRCVGFSLQWGFGGIEVFNLFAYRATNPRDLFEAKDAIGPENNSYLCGLRGEIMLAWGAFPRYLGNRDRDVLLMLEEDCDLLCLGYTLDGYPRHPVRLAKDTPREYYDIKPVREQTQ